MNTKKSKFQERLDSTAKKYLSEDDEGGINDKVKLHDTNLFSGDPQKKTRRATQTAQPPNAGQTYDWKETKKEKPPYYVRIHIWDGTTIFHNWARVSNGDEDYYVCTVYPEVDVIIEDINITHWSPPAGVIYPKYDPMTANDLPGYDLKQIIKTMKKIKVKASISFAAAAYNNGIDNCINIVERRLKKITKPQQLKLHNRNTRT